MLEPPLEQLQSLSEHLLLTVLRRDVDRAATRELPMQNVPCSPMPLARKKTAQCPPNYLHLVLDSASPIKQSS